MYQIKPLSSKYVRLEGKNKKRPKKKNVTNLRTGYISENLPVAEAHICDAEQERQQFTHFRIKCSEWHQKANVNTA